MILLNLIEESIRGRILDSDLAEEVFGNLATIHCLFIQPIHRRQEIGRLKGRRRKKDTLALFMERSNFGSDQEKLSCEAKHKSHRTYLHGLEKLIAESKIQNFFFLISEI